jgi:hypothetical protein
MQRYRCYLMRGEHIQAVQTYECADDAEVILKAGALLESKPEHPAIEIWEGKRLVARFTKDPPGSSNTQQKGNIYALRCEPA